MLNTEGGYLGFTFDGRHSSDFELLVVSDGSRYHQDLSNNFSDSMSSVPGKNGSYYFGTQFGNREFDIECVFDNMDTHTMHKIQSWLYPNKVGWLIFDETPYKKYLVKVSDVITPKFVPFDKYEAIKSYKFQKEILKGEISISFVTIDEYGYENENYDLPKNEKNELILQQAIDSGLLPSTYPREGIYLPHEVINIIKSDESFSLYNAGNGIAKADFYFYINKNDIIDESPLEIFNYDDGQNYIIKNPFNIIKKSNKVNNINNISKYRISILGTKKEIWLDCYGNDNNKLNSSSINIGGCYNQYYPKVNHTKPTDIMIMSAIKDKDIYDLGRAEPLFYTYSNSDEYFNASDSDNSGSFEEFKKEWEEYTLLTPTLMVEMNSLINPAFGFINYPNTDKLELQNEIVYLIYPNKYYCNKEITNFVAEYKHTYI